MHPRDVYISPLLIDYFGKRVYWLYCTTSLPPTTRESDESLDAGFEIVFRAIKSKRWRLVEVDGQPRCRGELAGQPGVDLEKIVVNSSMLSVNYVLMYGWSSITNTAVVERYAP